MDSLVNYQQIVKALLREREHLSCATLPAGLEVTCLFDDVTGQYALMSMGWMQGERVSGAILLLRLKNGKIWIEEDGTDAPIAADLLASGVPKEDIVLAWQPPEMRQYTEFAAA